MKFLDQYANETIEEEDVDEEIVCSVDTNESDGEERRRTPENVNDNDDAYGIFGHTAPRARKPSVPSSPTKSNPPQQPFLTVENNRCWKEISQRIPSDSSSKSSTYDSRKTKSSSLMNVAQHMNTLESSSMGSSTAYAIGESHSLTRRAFTPTFAHSVTIFL